MTPEGIVKGLVWINIFVGAWLTFTAWITPGGLTTSALTLNDAALGGLLIVLAAWTLISEEERPATPLWLQVLAGVWLVAAPFAFGFSPWNDVPAGLLAITISVMSLQFPATRMEA